MSEYLDFEDKIAVLENKIIDIKKSSASRMLDNVEDEIQSLSNKLSILLKETYDHLSPWQKVAVARHPNRPHTLHYIENLITNFTPLAGDRLYAEDPAIISGMGWFNNLSVMVIGIEKGEDLETRIKHNFGMPKPEGYRKASRLMKMADKFSMPIISFIDTPGAYPGQEAEERGQGEAIARSIETCLDIKVPLVSVIIGEGGSGGAVALASGDRVLMLEHAIYSVISPEGCASILWKNDKMAEDAAKSLKLTAQDLLKLKIIDTIIEEPVGGAHRDRKKTYTNVSKELQLALSNLLKQDSETRYAQKQQKILNMTN